MRTQGVRSIGAVVRAWPVLGATLVSAQPREATAQTDYETSQVASGVYQFRWGYYNALFVTTRGGVVAVDPLSVEAARQLAREIKKATPGQPMAAIVYSHSDADHATGAGALLAGMGQRGVPIIAHEKAVAPIRKLSSPDLLPPTHTFSDRLVPFAEDRPIELHYLGPSHTDNLVVPFIPDVGVAFAGDFVTADRVGYQDLPAWHFPEVFGAPPDS